MNDYKVTIGIEVHVELKTKTKVFSSSLNNYDLLPNSSVTLFDYGYPGSLPLLNKEVVDKGILTSLLLNCKVRKDMHFDRKNYFYPDLSKGYQITQADTPIGYDGYLDIGNKKVGITELHIEEDTCKSIHDGGKTYLNYNRAGVPLLEIVSEPDMNSKEEAMRYLERLRELLYYFDVSDCKMEEGSMRADVNISVSKTDKLGVRSEIKNIGSIKDVGVAIDYEIKRKIALLEKNEELREETRRFDSKTNSTILMRIREVDSGSRYFPDPDFPILHLTDEDISNIKKKIILTPDERRKIYLDKGIIDINVEKIINNKVISDYLNNFIDSDINFVIASNLLLGDISSYLNKSKIELSETKLTNDKFIELVNMLDDGTISSRICKDILDDVLETDLSIKDILSKNNITLLNDTDSLSKIIKEVLDENEASVKDYKSGKQNAIKYLMGMVMKKTKGAANPKMVNDLLIELLSKDVN